MSGKIKYYFALRDEIWKHYNKIGSQVSKEGLHEFLKLVYCQEAQREPFSITELCEQELNDLAECTKFYAFNHLGLDLDPDERLKLDFNRS